MTHPCASKIGLPLEPWLAYASTCTRSGNSLLTVPAVRLVRTLFPSIGVSSACGKPIVTTGEPTCTSPNERATPATTGYVPGSSTCTTARSTSLSGDTRTTWACNRTSVFAYFTPSRVDGRPVIGDCTL